MAPIYETQWRRAFAFIPRRVATTINGLRPEQWRRMRGWDRHWIWLQPYEYMTVGYAGCEWVHYYREVEQEERTMGYVSQKIADYTSKSATKTNNRAFEEWREEQIRLIEQTGKDFVAFLEKLRMSKDREEFDAFMAERKTK